MARKRSISPKLWENEQFIDLTAEARLVWIGLWSVCDRNGCFEWRPRKWALKFAAGLECDAESVFAQLQAAGFLERYEAGGEAFGFCVKWAKHQDPHPDEAPVHPMPASQNFTPLPPRCITKKAPAWVAQWYGTTAASGGGTTAASGGAPSSPSHSLDLPVPPERETPPPSPSGGGAPPADAGRDRKRSLGKKGKPKPPAWDPADDIFIRNPGDTTFQGILDLWPKWRVSDKGLAKCIPMSEPQLKKWLPVLAKKEGVSIRVLRACARHYEEGLKTEEVLNERTGEYVRAHHFACDMRNFFGFGKGESRWEGFRDSAEESVAAAESREHAPAAQLVPEYRPPEGWTDEQEHSLRNAMNLIPYSVIRKGGGTALDHGSAEQLRDLWAALLAENQEGGLSPVLLELCWSAYHNHLQSQGALSSLCPMKDFFGHGEGRSPWKDWLPAAQARMAKTEALLAQAQRPARRAS